VSTTQAKTVHITSGRTSFLQSLAELAYFRELLWFLAWRDVIVLYRQALIGMAWAVIRPVVTMLVFTVVFGRLAGLPSHGVPYPLLTFVAIVPWMFFSSGVGHCTTSVVGSSSVITKVYMPKGVIPAASVLAGSVDFVLSLAILFGLMAWYAAFPEWHRLLLLPIPLALLYVATLGVGLWVSALNVRYRDVQHAVPFCLNVLMYVSPVGFRRDVVPEAWQALYTLNPLVGIIEGFRWCLLPGYTGSVVAALALSGTVVAAVFISGLYYFSRVQDGFADVI
jgi:lipopolysaccharide transport system permease protein